MIIAPDVSGLRKCVRQWRQDGESVGVVPTMGALHAGHMALVEAAKDRCDRVIATIFVNPTQFNDPSDLANYPDTLKDDHAKLTAAGVDAVFQPIPDEVYPDGFSTRVVVDGLTDCLCGATRPGHMDGVTQVVAKLLNIAQADVAFFGEKDWQQLAVIGRMARDLNFVTEIAGVPTVRAEDGLALSSRNAYLTEAQRKIAPALNAAIRSAAKAIADRQSAHAACADAAKRVLAAGFEKIDYLECRDAASLALVKDQPNAPARVFAAAFLGNARLIDNVAILPSEPDV